MPPRRSRFRRAVTMAVHGGKLQCETSPAQLYLRPILARSRLAGRRWATVSTCELTLWKLLSEQVLPIL
jgi:hypothetical protein